MFFKPPKEEILFLLYEILKKENSIMTAIDDLNTSIDSLANAETTEVAALTAAIAAEGLDQSPAIEAAVSRINSATATLAASVTPVAPVTPVA